MKMPYLSYKASMKERYGEALFTLPINLELGCPNRDQTTNEGGCTFCPKHGGRAAQIADAKSIEEQITYAITFAKKRYKARSFALYLQAYTNTFSTLKEQKETYTKLLALHDFKAIYIGTRPDCLHESTLDYLVELNQICDVVIELGVQTLHDPTLKNIHRGHDAQCSLEAIKRLKARGLSVHVHLILGFENETNEMWKQSIQTLVALGIDGIKFHNLHIIKETDLALYYARHPFKLLDSYEYAEVLIELLRYIPSSMPIIRLYTDTPSQELVAPHWHMHKGMFSEYLIKTMCYRGICQGDALEKADDTSFMSPKKSLVLDDGSISFWNEVYGDYYHPKAGASTQARELFLHYSHLEQKLKKADVALLDIGFGMGYNSFECLQYAQENAHYHLTITAIDHDRILLEQSRKVVQHTLHTHVLNSLFTRGYYESDYVTIRFLNAEARSILTHLDGLYDIIFLDPFLEHKNASLISVDFLKKLANFLKPDGFLVTSTSLQASQIGLQLAGLKTKIIHIKNSDIKGIVATVSSMLQCNNEEEAYRDPYLVWSDKWIESEHQKKHSMIK